MNEKTNNLIISYGTIEIHILDKTQTLYFGVSSTIDVIKKEFNTQNHSKMKNEGITFQKMSKWNP